MKLLFDQNLSRHLVTRLAIEFPDSRHVTQLDLETATDSEIWEFAGQNGYVIVSKDSDFRQLAFLNGPPPKAIWLRVGNTTTSDIHRLLADSHETMTSFAEAADEALLVLDLE